VVFSFTLAADAGDIAVSTLARCGAQVKRTLDVFRITALSTDEDEYIYSFSAGRAVNTSWRQEPSLLPMSKMGIVIVDSVSQSQRVHDAVTSEVSKFVKRKRGAEALSWRASTELSP
jgi:hypothetical protein